MNLTDGKSSYDPTLLSNRASAFVELEKFDDALRDAEEYISLRPKCCKGYAKKALALYGLKRLWDAACVAALAYYYERNIFGGFKPFAENNFFQSLKDRIYICSANMSSLVASILHPNSYSQEKRDLPRKIVILEAGNYTLQTQLRICDCILIGVGDGATASSPLLSFQGRNGVISSGCINAENISLAFDKGHWESKDNCDATFLNCSFTNSPDRNQSTFPSSETFVSSGTSTFINCHFENCKEISLSVLGKTFVEKCVFSANGSCAVQVSTNGVLDIKNCKLHGNKLGIHIGPDAGVCRVIDCEIYDNRYQGIGMFCSPNINIIGNRIYQNDRHGIYLEGVSFTHIETNEIFENCWLGIATIDNARCYVVNNKIYRNKRGGVQVVPIGPGPEEYHSVVESNDIFDNDGPAIYDEMMFRDLPNISLEQTFNEHMWFYKHREQMRKAKCKQNKERSKVKTDHAYSEYERETVDFCGSCDEKKPLRSCTGCYSVGYCTKKCQRTDWQKHKSICVSLLAESTITVKVLPKQGFGSPFEGCDIQIMNTQAPGLDPKGPEYADQPKSGKRFMVKIQAGDVVRQSNLGGALLTIYDRSMTIHGDLDWKNCSLYHIVQQCGKNTHAVGWKKMFFWAVFTDRVYRSALRIFTKRLPPYQNW